MKNRIALLLMTALGVITDASAVFAGPAVAAGTNHTVVQTDTGTVWTWGANASGQLGDGTTTGRLTPTSIAITGVMAIAAGGDSSYALKTDGSVWAWGANGSGQLGTAPRRHAPRRWR